MSRVFDDDVLSDPTALNTEMNAVENLAVRAKGLGTVDLARLLVANSDDKGNDLPVLEAIIGLHAIEDIIRDESSTGPPEDDSGDSLAVKYWKAFVGAARYRKVALTDSGLIGLVPGIAKSGDLLVALRYSRHPFLLREIDSGYHYLLGQCYVDEAMPFQSGYSQIREWLISEENQIFRLR